MGSSRSSVKKRTETCEKEEQLSNPERRKAIFTRLFSDTPWSN
jgi:hypothetical protein